MKALLKEIRDNPLLWLRRRRNVVAEFSPRAWLSQPA
jgi:hypothetical protein